MKFFTGLTLFIAFISAISCHLQWKDGLHTAYNFEHYTNEFGKVYKSEQEKIMRELVFKQNLKRIMEINQNSKMTWKAGVNHLTDRIPSEIDAITGLNRDMSFHTRKFSSFKATTSKDFLQNLPKNVDWREKGVVTPIKNQGRCGSCWAFSSTAVLESHIAIQTGKLLTLSEQQLVDCTPNPRKCGGTGGCSGATQELAFDYVQRNGISEETEYAYNAKENKCEADNKKKVATIEDFVKLPENDYNALMTALATVGPVAVSVAAEEWSFYESGIFNGDCGATINHAVTAVGYGTDEEGNDYWLVRNSWGETWGEKGYIKVPREKTAKDVVCAMDTNTAAGTVCEGGPTEVKVCGKCGILSDSSYPRGGKLLN